MRMTVGKKITGGFLVVLALVLLMSIFSYWEIKSVKTSYDTVLEENLHKIEMAQGFAADLANEAVAMRRFNFTGDLNDIPIFNDYRAKSAERLSKLDQVLQSDKDKKLLQTMQDEKAVYETIAEKSIAAKQANRTELVGQYMQEAGKPYKSAMLAAEELVQSVHDFVAGEHKRQSDRVEQIQFLLLIMNVLVGIIAIALGIYVSRNIAVPMRLLAATANEVANGNLVRANVVVNSSDEVAQLAGAFNTMKDNLAQLIRKIGAATEQVASSSEELTASAEQTAQATNQVAESISDVAQGAQRQDHAVNNTATIVEEMSSSIRQAAGNTSLVTKMADRTTAAAEQGDKAVIAAMEQMQHIERTISNSTQVVAKLGERSKEIGLIVSTIAGIAGQTNLLALNAAIEAARAGEQGRGFSVVADEVRKLAEQAQEAAKQIADLISEIQTDTDRAVMAMDDGSREVRVGAEVVTNAGQAFKEIAGLIGTVSLQVREVSAAMEHMSDGSQQIVTSVQDIERISKEIAGQTQTVSAATQEQSATMEEIAASSQALARMAGELQSFVKRFTV